MRVLRAFLLVAATAAAVLAVGAVPASAAPPVCTDGSQSVRINTITSLVPNCGIVFPGPDFSSAVYTVTRPPEHGSVRVSSSITTTLRYLPHADYQGPDEFTYRVTTINGTSNEARISLDVAQAENRAPQCAVTPLPGVKIPMERWRFFEFHCTDAEGDSVTLRVIDGSEFAYNGEFLSGETVPRVSVIPLMGFTGADDFTVRATDSRGLSVDIPVAYEVVPRAPNAAPVCTAAPASATRDRPAQLGVVCTDPDGDPVEARVTVPPQHGVMSPVYPALSDMFRTHQGLYTPEAGYTGPESVTVVGRDDRGADSEPVVVSFTVDAPLAPMAPNCDLRAVENVPVRPGTTRRIPNVCVTFGGPSAPEITHEPEHGELVVRDGQFRYTPDAGYTGPDAFTYRMRTAAGAGPVKTQPVTVSPAANTSPSCGVSLPGRRPGSDDEPVVRQGIPASVRAACYDVDGDDVEIAIDDPSLGAVLGFAPLATLLPNEDPGITTAKAGTYEADRGDVGFDELRVRGDDGHGGEATGRQTLVVRPAGFNAPPSCGSTPAPMAVVVVEGGEAEYAEWCSDAEGDRIIPEFRNVAEGITIEPAASDLDGVVRTTVRAAQGKAGVRGMWMIPTDGRYARGAWYVRHVTVVSPPADVDRDLGPGESAGAEAEELPTAARPAQLRLTTLNEGRVKIETRSGSSPPGYSALGLTFDVTAPDATPEVPLRLRFRFDASIVPPGDLTSITVFRNGVAVPDCTSDGATPDPCVASRVVLANTDIEFVVRTSKASTWSFGRALVPPSPELLPGADAETPRSGGPGTTGGRITPDGHGGSSASSVPGLAPPSIAITRLPKLPVALAKGLKLRVASPFAGTARGRLTLDRRTAKRLRLSRRSAVVVATGAAPVAAGRQGTLALRFTKAARRALRRSKSVTLTLQVGVNDGPVTTQALRLRG